MLPTRRPFSQPLRDIRESAAYALIDLVRGALPGASRVVEAPEGVATKATAEGAPPRRKQPPSAGLGRKFVNLARKYTRSLMNPDYMLVASTYHVLAHNPVFHRIIVLLREHGVISPEDCIQFACDINVGFFGSPADDAPALLPRLRRHFQHALADQWLEAEVPAYAMGSALAGGLTPSPQPLQDIVELAELAMRVVAALAIVVDLPHTAEDAAQLAPAAQLYADDVRTFQSQICDRVGASLPEVHDLLEHWFNQCLAAIEDAESPLDRAILYRAALDCGRGAYEIAAYQRNEEIMRRWCSDLISWAKRARDRDITLEWHHNLVGILLESGEGRDTAEALLRQGTELFYAQRYEESLDKLFQARLLAERLGDQDLAQRCQQRSGWSKFFLGPNRSQ